MRDEPEIVKELREEEQCGRLHSTLRHLDDDTDFPDRSYGYPPRGQGEDEPPRGNMIQVSIEHEQRLLAAEERYEKIFRLSPQAIALLDKNGVFLEINQRLYDWLGFRPDEILGKSFLEVPIFTVDEKIKAKNKFLQRLAGKEVPPYELEFLTKNQEKRIGLVQGTSLKDEWGNITQSLVMISDVTKDRQAGDTLKNIAAIVESTDDAIIGKTLDGIITSWNQGAERIYGYSEQEVIGRPISLLVPPDYHNDSGDLLKRIQQGEHVNHYETIRVKKNGQRITVSLTISPIKDETGMIVGASTIARDVTERKKMEQDLCYRNRILDLIPDSIFLCDAEGRFMYVNKAAYASRGYTRDEMMKMRFHDLVAPEDQTTYASKLQTTKRGERQLELQHVAKNGSPVPVLMRTWVIDHDKENLILHLVHDMPREKKKAQTKHSPVQKKHGEKHTQRPAKARKQHHRHLK
jgi:PAS domain S-box-containing protein